MNIVCDQAYEKRHKLKLRYPVVQGEVTSFDDMEDIWTHCFKTELSVDPADASGILLSEHPLNPNSYIYFCFYVFVCVRLFVFEMPPLFPILVCACFVFDFIFFFLRNCAKIKNKKK